MTARLDPQLNARNTYITDAAAREVDLRRQLTEAFYMIADQAAEIERLKALMLPGDIIPE